MSAIRKIIAAEINEIRHNRGLFYSMVTENHMLDTIEKMFRGSVGVEAQADILKHCALCWMPSPPMSKTAEYNSREIVALAVRNIVEELV